MHRITFVHNNYFVSSWSVNLDFLYCQVSVYLKTMQATASRGRTGRRPSFCLSTDLPDIGGGGDMVTVRSSSGKQAVEPTWNPNEADPFGKKSSGSHSGNTIDRR